ncbi:MAG: N-acetylmuramoyl-L-alanine amidase [Alphaproteobacteria bacterium]|nr:N-acetylmuramoyl-L-alanine amidase [Alphaproteobacteria bacterium]
MAVLRWVWIGFFAGLILASGAQADTAVTRIDVDASGTVTLTLSEPVAADVFTLVNPYRLVIDLPKLTWRLQDQPEVAGVGAMLGVRVGQPDPDHARLVFDMSEPVSLVSAILAPEGDIYRLRVVLGPAGGVAALEVTPDSVVADLADDVTVGALAPGSADPSDLVTLVAQALAEPVGPSAPLPPRKPRLALPVIVIDPGHGGADPGALASKGRFEKDLTLTAAGELRDLLSRTGQFTVYLTRDVDVLLPLGERVAIAQRHDADLFISLHCDAIDDQSVRGATVYTLSETASDTEAQALAAKENVSDLRLAIDLVSTGSYDSATTSILFDLTRRETMNGSAKFAAQLSAEVGKVMALRRNNHRFAGFRVLKAPDIPSVLFEMGYLSNRKDLAILTDKASRRALLRAVVDAVEHYFTIVTASGP